MPMGDRILEPTPPSSLEGRVVLVTGAGSGIGAAVASAAAAAGAQLLLLGRRTEPLEAVYDAIEAAGAARPSIVPFDLAQAPEAAYDELAQLIADETGRLDGLVHCAGGVDRLSPVAHWRYADWHRIVQVHLNAAFALTRSLLPVLAESADASTVFSSCEIGIVPKAHWGALAAAKAGVEALATVLADEHGPGRGTRIHLIDPGPVRSPSRMKTHPGEARDAAPEAAGVAWAYLHLLSPEAAPLHGQRIRLAD